MPAPKGLPAFAIDVRVSQRDLDRVDKRLKQIQGADLAKRTEKALSAEASLLVNPIRANTPVSKAGQTGKYAHASGNMRKKVRTRKLSKRTGEMTAYYVGPSVYYSLFVQYGTRNQSANQFVQRTTASLAPQINAYVEQRVADLK